MQPEKPKLARPPSQLEMPAGQDIVTSVVPQVLASRPLLEIAENTATDVGVELAIQAALHFTPLGNAAAHYRAGTKCYANCRYADALAHFSAAIEHDASNIVSWFERARTYSMLGQPDRSIADYTEIIRREPGYRAAYQNRGLNHWTRGDIAAADADFDHAQRLATEADQRTFVSAIRLEMHGQYGAAIDAHADYLATHPDSTYSRYRRAECYLKCKQPELALADLDILLEYDPKNLSGYWKRGRLYVDEHRFAEAVEDFRRALTLDPESSYSHYWLARGLQGLEQWDAAIASYQRCLELDLKTYAAHWYLGVIHAECGRPAEAIAAYTAYIEQQADPEWRRRAQEQIDRLRSTVAA